MIICRLILGQFYVRPSLLTGSRSVLILKIPRSHGIARIIFHYHTRSELIETLKLVIRWVLYHHELCLWPRHNLLNTLSSSPWPPIFRIRPAPIVFNGSIWAPACSILCPFFIFGNFFLVYGLIIEEMISFAVYILKALLPIVSCRGSLESRRKKGTSSKVGL